MYQSSKPLPPITHHARHEQSPPPPPPISKYSDEESISPSIDGPPSPTRIRMYTEQMKMAAQYPPPTRPHNQGVENLSTKSMTSSSMMSRSSSNSDIAKLSRKSSRSSIGKKSGRGERPESVISFGKTLFSRTKKSKREFVGSRSSSSQSNHVQTIDEHPSPARQRYYGGDSGRSSRRGTLSSSTSSIEENPSKIQISVPFNFQHVTHTRQDHLPDLHRTSCMELASEFSAMRASQAPTHGTLKEIRTQDLHFENFSSEAINEEPGRRPRTAHLNSVQPTKSQATNTSHRPCLNHAQSHDNLQSLRRSPPRPIGESKDQSLPIPPPPRTSSRTTASGLWDHFSFSSPNASSGRTQTLSSGTKAPKTFHLPISNPTVIQRSTDAFFFENTPQAQRSAALETWPLQTPEVESSKPQPQLPDVPEEDEGSAKRRSMIARSNMRYSKSVPEIRDCQSILEDLAMPAIDVTTEDRPETPLTASTLQTNEQLDDLGTPIGVALSPTRDSMASAKAELESWEDDIDYCYEHEVEADCEYEWDRCSLDNEPSNQSLGSGAQPKTMNASPNEQLDRFRPSLLVPSALDLPSLSPTTSMSSITPTSIQNPLTPGAAPGRPTHLRSPSQASSFKESHGFNLSPSLLIPTDYSTAMTSLFRSESDNSLQIYNSEPVYVAPLSPSSNARSSTTSSSTSTYRSSAFSRSSHTSNYTTASSISFSTQFHKSASQESMQLPYRPVNSITSAPIQNSMSSSTSLPELAQQLRNQLSYDNSSNDFNDQAAPAPGISHSSRRKRSNSNAKFVAQHIAPIVLLPVTSPAASIDSPVLPTTLSPVHEIVSKVMAGEQHPAISKFEAALERKEGREREHSRSRKVLAEKGFGHGRMGSAPLLSLSGADMMIGTERPKTSGGRKRASSTAGSKNRAGGYALFPQV